MGKQLMLPFPDDYNLPETKEPPTDAALQKQQGDDDHDTTNDTRDRRRRKAEKLSVGGRQPRRPYVGARNSPRSQPAVSRDFNGSASFDRTLMKSSQAGHSNVRMSKPEAPGVIRASIVIAVHFGHGGL